VQVASATAIAGLGAAASSLSPKLGSLYDSTSSAWVRSAILPALAAIDPAKSDARVQSALSDTLPVQLAAIGALGTIASDADVASLVSLATNSDARLAAAAIEALTLIDPSRTPATLKDTMRSALATQDVEVTTSVADVTVAFGWKDFAPDLSKVYDAFPGSSNLNARLEIAWALGSIGTSDDLGVLGRALQDDERIVEQFAAASIQQLTGMDVSGQVRPDSVVRTQTPSADEVDAALASTVLLGTTQGLITIRMRPEAPLSATNFVRLVDSGFYDGLTFHRVVPDFVAQGGDPRADGFGGSDQLVREEISTLEHKRGTVGMATEGKDTGSSQFFINLGWNVTLDGRYTIFGEVESGIDVADALQVGDSIYSATVL
jgi:cyclophilin family peptidyl-prolyl cis-trans isomerase